MRHPWLLAAGPKHTCRHHHESCSIMIPWQSVPNLLRLATCSLFKACESTLSDAVGSISVMLSHMKSLPLPDLKCPCSTASGFGTKTLRHAKTRTSTAHAPASSGLLVHHACIADVMQLLSEIMHRTICTKATQLPVQTGRAGCRLTAPQPGSH